MDLDRGSPGTIGRAEGDELPRSWRELSLGALEQAGKIMIRSGFAQGEHNTGGQGVPHLRPFNVTGDGRVDLTQVKYVAPPCGERVPWVCRGDVILNNTNSEDLVGKTAHFPLDGSYLLSNHMTLIRVLDSDSVDAYWLASRLHYEWTIGTFRSMLRRYVGQATVSLQRLRELVLPFPSVGEQRAIAETLRSVRQAKEATEAVIAATRQLKKSLMRHLFTSGPVPVQEAERVPLKETEIGPMPEHWQVVALGAISQTGGGSVQTGPFGSMLHASDYVAEGIPVVMPKDLSDDGRILDRGVAKITAVDAERLNRYRLKAGDVLVGRRGELGRRGLVTAKEDGWLCGTGCLRVRPGTALSAQFLVYAFETCGTRSWLAANAVGTTMPNLSAEILSRLPIILPPLSVQEQIASIPLIRRFS